MSANKIISLHAAVIQRRGRLAAERYDPHSVTNFCQCGHHFDGHADRCYGEGCQCRGFVRSTRKTAAR